MKVSFECLNASCVLVCLVTLQIPSKVKNVILYGRNGSPLQEEGSGLTCLADALGLVCVDRYVPLPQPGRNKALIRPTI